jgi:hypothetical protein
VIAATGDPTPSERDLEPETPMIPTQFPSAELKSDVSPLLRSIAVELRERTSAVHELEERQSMLEPQAGAHEKELLNIIACLAVHRRELRGARKELERLGWIVEEIAPLRLVRMDDALTGEAAWQITDTGFHRIGNG